MKLKRIPHTDGSTYGYAFECLGCKETHVVPTSGHCAWSFNGSEEAPTFSPSILVYPRDFLDGTVVRQTPRCHSFVRDGRIEYLGDCTHALAGQTVELPEIEP